MPGKILGTGPPSQLRIQKPGQDDSKAVCTFKVVTLRPPAQRPFSVKVVSSWQCWAGGPSVGSPPGSVGATLLPTRTAPQGLDSSSGPGQHALSAMSLVPSRAGSSSPELSSSTDTLAFGPPGFVRRARVHHHCPRLLRNLARTSYFLFLPSFLMPRT